jgi:glutathione S-transferase
VVRTPAPLQRLCIDINDQQPECAHVQAREGSKGGITSSLAALEAHVASGPKQHIAGGAMSAADVALAAVLHPTFSGVLGAAGRAPYPATLTWLQATCTHPAIATALGACAIQSAAWQAVSWPLLLWTLEAV